MTEPHPPTTVEEISAVWLDRALRHSGILAVEVEAIEVTPLGPAAGLLGDLARVGVTYRSGSGPSTVIVKLPTTDPGGRRVGEMLRAWPREIAFYRDLAPQAPDVDVPLCFHHGGTPTAPQGRPAPWVLVLEDCHSDPIDVAVGATDGQAFGAVEALARFHAAWWQSSRTFDWMPGFDTTGVGGLQPAWLDAIPTFLRRYGHLIPDPTGTWLERFAPRLSAWSDRVALQPLTVVHADFRLDNLLFDGNRVTIIDWQTALRGPGAMDLTSFIATGLTADNRRRLESDLIDRYVLTLAGRGVVVDRTSFQWSYDENLLWWMGQFANNLARLEPDDPLVQRALDTMIERTYHAALDRDVGRLLRGGGRGPLSRT